MSSLDSVSASADAFAERYLRYLALRQESPLSAARLREQMGLEAVALRANIAVSRSRRDEAVKSVKPMLSRICRCGCAACPQPPLNHANENSLSMGPNLA